MFSWHIYDQRYPFEWKWISWNIWNKTKQIEKNANEPNETKNKKQKTASLSVTPAIWYKKLDNNHEDIISITHKYQCVYREAYFK